MHVKTDFLKPFYLVLLTIFLACDKSEIEQNITITVDFVLDESSLEFNGLVFLNAFDESHVLDDYGDNITGIEILNIIYFMSYFNGPGSQQFNSANLEVTGPDGSGAAIIASLSDEIMQNLLYERKEMPLQEEGVKRLEKLIKNEPHEFRLLFTGISNIAPNDFTFTLEIGMKMSAFPL